MYSKTRVILHTLLIIAGLGWAMMECSCARDNEKESAQVNLSYSINWDKAFANYSHPRKLRYCFYPSNGGPMLRMDGDADGFKITLPADIYNVLVFNYDATDIQFNNLEEFHKAEARLATTKAAGNDTDNQIPLYGLAINNMKVNAGEEIQESLHPIPLVKEISFNINIRGSEYVNSCKGSLSGVASTLSLSKQVVVPEEPATVDIRTSFTGKGVKGSAIILGTAAQSGSSEGEKPAITNQLTLDFMLIDGSTLTATADLGHSLADDELPPDVHIDIEATVSPSPNFAVTLNSWKIASGDSMTIQ